MFYKQPIHIVVVLAFLLLCGCLDNSLTFQVRFAKVSGLKPDAPVFFENNEIGKVQKIIYTQQGDYLVSISINKEFKNAATVYSKFFIGHNPVDQQSKAITVSQERHGGAVLEKGAIITGSTAFDFLGEIISELKANADVYEDEMRQALQQFKTSIALTSQQLDTKMGNALAELSLLFHRYSEEVKNIPNREEIKQLEQSIQQFADEFNRSQQTVRDHLREEVLPQLRKQLDYLRKQLQQEGRENEIEEIDKRLEEINMT